MPTVRFLLLEDNLADAEKVQFALTNGGIDAELLRVQTRPDFVTALETKAFDLILTAYTLSDFDGLAALETALNLCPETPLIFISTSLGEELAIETLKRGAADYVFKQRLERLVPAIQRALQEAQERRERQQVEAALRESEAEYRTLLESIDQGFCICEMLFDENGNPHDYRFLKVNSVFEQLTGLQDPVGKTIRELVHNFEAVWIEIYGSVVQTGEPVRVEHRSTAMNRWFDVNAFPIGDRQSNQFAVLFTNVTERKRTERNREFLATVSQDLAEITCVDEIVQTIGASLNRHLQVSVCVFGEINERADEVVISYDWQQGDRPSLIGVHSLPEFVTDEFLRMAKAGEPIVVRNYATDSRIVDPSRYEALDIGAEIHIPLIRDGKWRFSLVVFHQQVYDWRDDEIQLMQELASWTWTKLERARAEAALSESRAELERQVQKFDIMLSTITDLVFSFDRTGRVLYANQPLLDFWGVTAAEAIGKTLAELNYPEAIERTFLQNVFRVFETGETVRDEIPSTNSAGIEGYFEYILSPVFAANRTVEFVIGSSRDISDRQRTEQLLRESEAQTRNILESLHEAFFALDENWRFTYVNRSAGILLNLAPDDFIGKNIWEEYPGLSGNDLAQVYWKAMHDRTTASLTAFYPDHDRWYEVRTYPAASGISVYFRNVTDQIQAEEAVRQSEARFRRIFECDMVPMGMYTKVGGVIEANHSLLNLIGYTQQELEAGQISWQALTPPEYRSLDEGALSEVEARGVSTPYEKVFIHKDGRRIPILIGAALFLEDASSGVFFAIDLSDRKQAEDTLRDREAQLAAEANALVRLNEASSRLWRKLNLSEGLNEMLVATIELLGADMGNIQLLDIEQGVLCIAVQQGFKPDFLDFFREVSTKDNSACGRTLRAGKRTIIEDVETDAPYAPLRPVARAAGYRAVQSTPLLGRDGTPLGMLSTHWRSSHRPSDQDLRRLDLYVRQAADFIESIRAETALRQSEERYRTLFESIDQGFCVCELIVVDEANDAYDYRILETNPAFETLTGLQQATGKTGSELIPGLEPFWYETYARVVKTGEPTRFESYLQAWNRWFDVYVTPIEIPQNQQFAVLFSNITDRKRAEVEREQLLQREQTARETAENANRIKDEFLAVLSHELRSPLNPILGWTRLLQTGKLAADRQSEALATIERNAKLQTQLIEDLLDISRIIQGKMSLTVAPVSLSFVISAALETVRLAAEAKQIAIALDLDSSVACVSGDATRLQQVVWNLLTNAVKFTPTGGQVTVELRQCDHLAQMRVTDTGKGIAPNFLPHIFEYFRQEDGSTTRKFGGLGLGLAIAQQIVELHGGTIAAQSAGEGQGATFTVQIPLASRLSVLPVIEPPSDATENLSGIRILVVDDETDSREFVSFVLEQAGAIVTRVASGIDALQTFSQFTLDLIVSDIGMPEMDGYMLMRQIRALPEAKHIRAIALTAYAGELDRQQAIAAGFQAHLAKPVNPDQLLNVIHNLIASFSST